MLSELQEVPVDSEPPVDSKPTVRDVAISVDKLSKCYRVFQRPQDRLIQMLTRGRKQLHSEFWALHDVSFEIEAGSTVGILGRNGAGKSTLLQMICGTLSPTSGQISVAGRISALLELGTGFNPEFTGRENIYLNASILGLSHEETTERFDDIVGFADIGDFIEQPVKTYSSGMFIRLAFGVAIHVDPDILVVDEALSVGDVKFQAKCFRKFEEFRSQGKTILLVSHSPEEIVRHCNRAMLIDGGKLVATGDPRTVTNRYLDMMFGIKPDEKSDAGDQPAATVTKRQVQPAARIVTARPSKPTVAISVDEIAKQTQLKSAQEFVELEVFGDNATLRPGYNQAEYRWGSKEAEIIDYMICTENRFHVNHFEATEHVFLYLKVKFHADVPRPIYGLTIKTPDGITVYGTNSRDWSKTEQFTARHAEDITVVCFALVPELTTGHYLLSLGVVTQSDSDEIEPLDRRYDLIEVYVSNQSKCFGIADLGMKVAHVT